MCNKDGMRPSTEQWDHVLNNEANIEQLFIKQSLSNLNTEIARVLWKKVCDHVIKVCIKMCMPKINQLRFHGLVSSMLSLLHMTLKWFLNVIFYTCMFNKNLSSSVNEYNKQ